MGYLALRVEVLVIETEQAMATRIPRVGDRVTLKRFPFDASRQRENEGWRIDAIQSNGSYLLRHHMGGITNATRKEFTLNG